MQVAYLEGNICRNRRGTLKYTVVYDIYMSIYGSGTIYSLKIF